MADIRTQHHIEGAYHIARDLAAHGYCSLILNTGDSAQERVDSIRTLEQRKVEAENSEIVDIVRGMSIPLAELPLVLQQLRAGKTLGQNDQKSEEVSE